MVELAYTSGGRLCATLRVKGSHHKWSWIETDPKSSERMSIWLNTPTHIKELYRTSYSVEVYPKVARAYAYPLWCTAGIQIGQRWAVTNKSNNKEYNLTWMRLKSFDCSYAKQAAKWDPENPAMDGALPRELFCKGPQGPGVWLFSGTSVLHSLVNPYKTAHINENFEVIY